MGIYLFCHSGSHDRESAAASAIAPWLQDHAKDASPDSATPGLPLALDTNGRPLPHVIEDARWIIPLVIMADNKSTHSQDLPTSQDFPEVKDKMVSSVEVTNETEGFEIVFTIKPHSILTSNRALS